MFNLFVIFSIVIMVIDDRGNDGLRAVRSKISQIFSLFHFACCLFPSHFFNHFHSLLLTAMWLTLRLFFAENLGGACGTEIKTA